LQSFQTGARRNDAQGQMQAISRRLSASEQQVLADFLSRLPSSPQPAKPSQRPMEQKDKKSVKSMSNDSNSGEIGASKPKGTNRIDAVHSIHIITCYNMLV
jgi:hypothetical protein